VQVCDGPISVRSRTECLKIHRHGINSEPKRVRGNNPLKLNDYCYDDGVEGGNVIIIIIIIMVSGK
jgi:hypothetical protein